MSMIETEYCNLSIKFSHILALFRILFVQINCLFERMFFYSFTDKKEYYRDQKAQRKVQLRPRTNRTNGTNTPSKSQPIEPNVVSIEHETVAKLLKVL